MNGLSDPTWIGTGDMIQRIAGGTGQDYTPDTYGFIDNTLNGGRNPFLDYTAWGSVGLPDYHTFGGSGDGQYDVLNNDLLSQFKNSGYRLGEYQLGNGEGGRNVFAPDGQGGYKPIGQEQKYLIDGGFDKNQMALLGAFATAGMLGPGLMAGAGAGVGSTGAAIGNGAFLGEGVASGIPAWDAAAGLGAAAGGAGAGAAGTFIPGADSAASGYGFASTAPSAVDLGSLGGVQSTGLGGLGGLSSLKDGIGTALKYANSPLGKLAIGAIGSGLAGGQGGSGAAPTQSNLPALDMNFREKAFNAFKAPEFNPHQNDRAGHMFGASSAVNPNDPSAAAFGYGPQHVYWQDAPPLPTPTPAKLASGGRVDADAARSFAALQEFLRSQQG